MNKKIYFAGSIRGGRADAALYQRLISFMEETDIVLTEHIGNLSLSPKEASSREDQKIYQEDMAWLNACDLVIAEASVPSLGVGYELATAERLNKETHVFYRPKTGPLSAMISGDPYFHVHPYDNEKELLEEVRTILAEEK